jgi:hypothetical protein
MPFLAIFSVIKGFFGGITGGDPLKTWGTIIFAALIGFAVGNYHATQRAVKDAAEVVADHAAREMAAATGALLQQHAAQKTATDKDVVIARHADDHAFATLSKSALDAQHDKDLAFKALAVERAKPREIHSETPIPASCPEPVDFSWPGSVRVLLDTVAGAIPGSDPADSAADAPAAGRAARSAPAAGEAARLTPDDVAQGYGALSAHDRVCRARLTAWQDWWRERFSQR